MPDVVQTLGAPLRAIVAIPFPTAFLCVNCSCVVDRGDRCVVCESVALLNLAKVLDGAGKELI